MVRVQRAWTSQVRVEKPAGTGNNGGKQEAKRNCEGNSGTKLTGGTERCRVQGSVKSREELDGSLLRLVRYGEHPFIPLHFPLRPAE